MRVPPKPDGAARHHNHHLDPGGEAQHHFHEEQFPMGNRICPQLAEIDGCTQAGGHQGNQLPIQADAAERQRQILFQIAWAGDGCGQPRTACDCHKDAVPEEACDRRHSRPAPEKAHAAPLRPQNRADHSQPNRSTGCPAPTTRTKASSSDSPPARRSASVPEVTILPRSMMATRSHSRSTTSSTWLVRKIVAPRFTWSSRMSFIRRAPMASTPSNGSSIRNNSGWWMSDAAIATRLRIPFEY